MKSFMFLAAGFLAFVVAAGAGSVYAAKYDTLATKPAVEAKDPILRLTRGKADTLSVEGAVSDIMVADPTIVDVTMLQSNKLYVVGRALGDTNLIVLDAQGNTLRRMNVHVRIDESVLQDAIQSLFPKEDVRVETVNSQVVLTGRVSSAMVSNRIRDIALRFLDAETADIGVVNMLDVAGEQQVMLQVRIVEATRTVLRELGVETNFNDPQDTTPPLFDTVPPDVLPDGAEGAFDEVGQLLGNGAITDTPAAVARVLKSNLFSELGTMEVLLRALEEQSLVNVLAEPNLTALSGEEANFLVGGRFPVPSGVGTSGDVTFSYQPFGVTLNFIPTVLSNDRISLQLNTEISERDTSGDVDLQGITTLPAFTVRRTSTSVELPSGGSLMIAGLLNSRTLDNYSGLPGIANTPVLGDLIKSKRFQRNETEVVILVKSYLVRPYADSAGVERKPDPANQNNHLAKAFAATVRRTYGNKVDDLLQSGESYGYLID